MTNIETDSSPSKGRVFRSSLSASAQTLRTLNPEIIDLIAKETESDAVAAILAGPIRNVKMDDKAIDISWDFSWDFSWDYSTRTDIFRGIDKI